MAFKGWDKTVINTRDGQVEGVAPVIISASRATDIPAYHSRWFMNRLENGYVKWINPFNRQPQYISFAKTRVIVFWTKNPEPMLDLLPQLDQAQINYYFQYTLNDYQSENLEPNLPSLEERISTFKDLSRKIGKEKVIWRFDPLVLMGNMTVADLLARIERVGQEIHAYTSKLVVSFVDIKGYQKVERNLQKQKLACRELTTSDINELAEGLQELNQSWNLALATCAEGYDLSDFGIQPNKCIDGQLMLRLFSHDQKLLDFLHQANNLKDKGQRALCGCIASKDIGQYNTCLNLCAYCYANNSPRTVRTNFNSIEKLGWNSETIIPQTRDMV